MAASGLGSWPQVMRRAAARGRRRRLRAAAGGKVRAPGAQRALIPGSLGMMEPSQGAPDVPRCKIVHTLHQAILLQVMVGGRTVAVALCRRPSVWPPLCQEATLIMQCHRCVGGPTRCPCSVQETSSRHGCDHRLSRPPAAAAACWPATARCRRHKALAAERSACEFVLSAVPTLTPGRLA